jgi:hypothetical protein
MISVSSLFEKQDPVNKIDIQVILGNRPPLARYYSLMIAFG